METNHTQRKMSYETLLDARCEIQKMFYIMEQEYSLRVERYKHDQAAGPKKYGCRPSRHGRIGVDFGVFTNKSKKLLKLSKVLSLVFNTHINLKSEYCRKFIVDLDIIVDDNEFRTMLLIVDTKTYGEDSDRTMENIIDVEMTKIELVDILSKLLYELPRTEIRGAIDGITDIPLSQNYLEKYIHRGIRYFNTAAFYERLELMKEYDMNHQNI